MRSMPKDRTPYRDGVNDLVPPERLRATRRFGAFAVLTLRAIERIKDGELTSEGAAAHFERVAQKYKLRESRYYDPRFIDMLIARVRRTRRIEHDPTSQG
jgi:hypothetical protein